jgi:hypothetical protein
MDQRPNARATVPGAVPENLNADVDRGHEKYLGSGMIRGARSINRRRSADCEPGEWPLIKIAQDQCLYALRARQMANWNCRPLP